MDQSILIVIISLVLAAAVAAAILIKKYYSEAAVAQRELNQYLNKNHSPLEVGTLYERYIGHLYETDGYEVIYNGALNGYEDLGRDLIVKSVYDTFIIQTKCWAKDKLIQEKHIFQLYGSMTHFQLTQGNGNKKVKAIFYTTARYSQTAIDVAKTLGVELRTKALNRSYPMIKCAVSHEGEKVYYLPFDIEYDAIQINLHKKECFANTVKEAMEKGFRRAA